MAGRPRTMARRVQRLWERFSAVLEELEQLMPEQYRATDSGQLLLKHERQPSNDEICQAWREATDKLYEADDRFGDLACCLNYKAKQADERAGRDAVEVVDDPDDPDDDQPVTAQEAATETEGQNADEATPGADTEKLPS